MQIKAYKAPLKTVFCAILLSITCLASCDAEEEEEEEVTVAGEGGAGEVGGSGTGAVASANSVDDLNLSSALQLSTPSSLSGQSASLALAASSKKSKEACEVGQIVEDGLSTLAGVASMFCHFEAEKDNILFGKKYTISFTGGKGGAEDGGTMGLWIDNATEGVLKVSFCQDGTLNQVITITGSNESGGSKGTVVDHGSFGGQSWARAIAFDIRYSDAGTQFITSKDAFTNTEASEVFRRQLVLSLLDSGVDKVLVSSSGTWGGSTFAHAGAARVDDSYGQVLFKTKGTYNGEAFDHTKRSYFNSTGYIVPQSDSATLASGGSLYVPDSDVPKMLDSSFAVDSFASTEWDCTGGEELVLDMSGSNGDKHDACEAGMEEKQRVDCWGSDYQESEETHTIDEDKQKDHDKLDDVSEVSE